MLTEEMQYWLDRGKRYQRLADKCSAKLRDLHKLRSESHPSEYLTVRLVPKS